MALNKKKISDYPIADSLVGLWTLGYSAVDGIKKSFRVSLEFLKNAADRADASAQNANNAAAAATSAAEGANTAAAAATSAAQDAENNVTDVAELQSKVAVNADAIATNSARIAELQGRGGSIPAAAFGADDPASEGMQEAFTHHAANAIWGADGTFAWNSVEPAASTWTSADGATVHTAAEIFNSTWTRNTDNGHRIVLNNTQDTDPAIYEWADVGVDTVNVATSTAAGIVLSDTPDGEFVVDPATGSVTLAEQVATPGTIVENTTKFSSGVRKTLKAWVGDLFTKVNGLISSVATLKTRIDSVADTRIPSDASAVEEEQITLRILNTTNGPYNYDNWAPVLVLINVYDYYDNSIEYGIIQLAVTPLRYGAMGYIHGIGNAAPDNVKSVKIDVLFDNTPINMGNAFTGWVNVYDNISIQVTLGLPNQFPSKYAMDYRVVGGGTF